ncbi:MAG: hypothetical protein IJR96_07205 [Pseudobutyrivibrio sp.]|nr:hypothetical protein [Pseudobutyrivibrio sp.]
MFVVLIGIVLIFKQNLISLVASIFKTINTQAGQV